MKSHKRIRVGVDARSLLCREPRGEGKSLLRLYQEIRLQRPDIEAVFFGDHTTVDFRGELPQGISTVPIDLPGDRFSAWENLYFPAAATMARCNVLHCTSSGGPFWSPQPQLLTVHDLIPALFDDGLSEEAKVLFMKRLKNGLRNSKRIITVSTHTRKDLLKTFHGLRTPIDVIHWGCDLANTEEQTPPVDSPYVIAFGGEAKRKNTTFTLERFFAVANAVPTLKLLLVGVSSKQQREKLAQKALQAGLADRVVLPGFVSEGELDGLIRNASALLYLSLYEGFGLPLLEAIGRGVPVIASDCTSIPEILDDAPGCFSLDSTEAIEEAILSLVTDHRERERWQRAQSGVLPRFNWERTARQTIDALEYCT